MIVRKPTATRPEGCASPMLETARNTCFTRSVHLDGAIRMAPR